jgi:hypothetical protein
MRNGTIRDRSPKLYSSRTLRVRCRRWKRHARARCRLATTNTPAGRQGARLPLNLLTDERTRAAAALVRRGAVFPLNLPLHEPQPHLAWRTPPAHHILHAGHEARGMRSGGADDPSTGLIDRDDYIDGLWLQGGSQWDSLSHVRHRQYGNYNGVADAETHGGPGTKRAAIP